MKNLIGTIFAISLSSSAFASHYDSCKFEAEVVAVTALDKLNDTVISSPEERQPHALVVKITAAEQLAGHGTCLSRIGHINVLQLEAGSQRFGEGSTIRLSFDTMGGLTPEGFWNKNTWSLID
jgi:hypothetical protein